MNMVVNISKKMIIADKTAIHKTTTLNAIIVFNKNGRPYSIKQAKIGAAMLKAEEIAKAIRYEFKRKGSAG